MFQVKYEHSTCLNNLCFLKSFVIKKQTKAFSLIEMLMSLLVASLLMAAIAPVVTKKFEQKVNINGNDSDIRYRQQCFIESTPDDGVILNETTGSGISAVNFLLVSGGGGGGGASIGTLGVEQNKEVKGNSNIAGSSGEISFAPNEYPVDIKLDFMSGGGGGGGAGGGRTSGFIPSADSCRNITGEDTSGHRSGDGPIAVYNEDANVCVSGYPQNPNGYTGYRQDGEYLISPNDSIKTPIRCHKYNNFAANANIDSSHDYYVCTYHAAVDACKNLGEKLGNNNWTLPGMDILTLFANNEIDEYSFIYKRIADGGMQACTFNAITGNTIASSYICRSYSENKGTIELNNSTYNFTESYAPYRTWSTSNYNYEASCTDENGDINNNGGSGYSKRICLFSTSNHWGRSVSCRYYTYIAETNTLDLGFGTARCVLGADATITFHQYSGKGGNAAPSIKNPNSTDRVSSEISNAIQKIVNLNHNGKILISTGKGGNGGVANGANATAGEESCIIVKDVNTNIEWYKVCTQGGDGGKNATNTSNATDSIGISNTGKCYSKTYNGLVYSDAEIECTTNSDAGLSGTDANAPGAGGRSAFNDSLRAQYNISTGTGHTVSNDYPGAGGGAGRGVDESHIGNGGVGTGGKVSLRYNLYKPGNSGGGGSGGNLLSIKNVNLGAGAVRCKVKVGIGGAGGETVTQNPDYNGNGKAGNDGGFSSIECNETGEFRVNGGTGGGAGRDFGITLVNSNNPNPNSGGVAVCNSTLPSGNFDYICTKGTDGGNPLKDPSELVFNNIGGDGGKGPVGNRLIYAGGRLGGPGSGYSSEGMTAVLNLTYLDLVLGATVPGALATGGYGGGGGAYASSAREQQGKGGDGSPGYVCVYWINR